MAFFHPSVELWRPALGDARGDIPLEFLLAFIQRESNGNPCSFTKYREAGIFQLMPGDNQNVAGTNEAALRAGCTGDTQSPSMMWSVPQATRDAQVVSGIQYVQWARGEVHKYSQIPETSPDFWRLVKMIHVAPAIVHRFGPAAPDWDTFRAAALVGGTPASWLDNAEWVGGYGVGGGDSVILAGVPDWLTILLGVGTGLVLWKAGSWARHRYLHAA